MNNTIQRTIKSIKSRKGIMAPLVNGAISLMVVTIVVSVSVILLANFKTSQAGQGQAGNISSDLNSTLDNGIAAVKTFSQNLTTLALVIIFGIIIGAVLLYFGVFGQRE